MRSIRPFNGTSIVATMLAIFLASAASAQDIRTLRVGVKLGTLNVIGLNLESVTPLLDHHLSADLDLTSLKLSSGEVSVGYTALAIGANYYFTQQGRNLYGGLAYGRLRFNAEETLTGTINGTAVSARGEGSLTYNNLNVKVGGKHGGLFYFRWELGYALSLSSGDLIVSAEASDGIETVRLEEKIDVPFIALPIMNIGFGFSF